jgi:transcription initiation factor TFIID subunit 5
MDEVTTPAPVQVKVEHWDVTDSDLISPGEGETNPPIPAVFRIVDLKREVEAVRDKRKMIRLGPGGEDGKSGASGSIVLPSVVAFTMFDSGEG